MGTRPAPTATCHVPDCNEPGRLYPAGWLCEDHKPGKAREK